MRGHLNVFANVSFPDSLLLIIPSKYYLTYFFVTGYPFSNDDGAFGAQMQPKRLEESVEVFRTGLEFDVVVKVHYNDQVVTHHVRDSSQPDKINLS